MRARWLISFLSRLAEVPFQSKRLSGRYRGIVLCRRPPPCYDATSGTLLPQMAVPMATFQVSHRFGSPYCLPCLTRSAPPFRTQLEPDRLSFAFAAGALSRRVLGSSSSKMQQRFAMGTKVVAMHRSCAESCRHRHKATLQTRRNHLRVVSRC